MKCLSSTGISRCVSDSQYNDTIRLCSCKNSLSFSPKQENNSPNPRLATLPTRILYGLQWKMQILFSAFVPSHMNGDYEEFAHTMLARGNMVGGRGSKLHLFYVFV